MSNKKKIHYNGSYGRVKDIVGETFYALHLSDAWQNDYLKNNKKVYGVKEKYLRIGLKDGKEFRYIPDGTPVELVEVFEIIKEEHRVNS